MPQPPQKITSRTRLSTQEEPHRQHEEGTTTGDAVVWRWKTEDCCLQSRTVYTHLTKHSYRALRQEERTPSGEAPPNEQEAESSSEAHSSPQTQSAFTRDQTAPRFTGEKDRDMESHTAEHTQTMRRNPNQYAPRDPNKYTVESTQTRCHRRPQREKNLLTETLHASSPEITGEPKSGCERP